MYNIKDKLSKLPRGLYVRIKLIASIADNLGYPVYVIGGFVRDLLLGVDNLDLDIVVEGDGIALAKELSLRLNGKLVKHKRFGTATITVPGKTKIDIATARGEIYEHPGSLPTVTPGVIKDDLARRDFSINAIGFSLRRSNFGELIDFFNGRGDLRSKKIRVLHDLSFRDDPTRILRAIRFEQRYRFKIEPYTLSLLKNAVSLKMLNKVQKQRLRDEIILLLKERHPLKCLMRLAKICGFDFIHPAIHINTDKACLLEKIDKGSAWFQNNFPHKRRLDLWLAYLTILLTGLNKQQINKVVYEFAFRKGEAKRIISFTRDADKIISKLKTPLSPSNTYRLLMPVSYEVLLLIAIKAAGPDVLRNIKNFLRHYNEARIFTGGDDLKKVGIAPGPRYKDILKKILYAKLDNRLTTKEEELHYLKNKILKPR